MKIKIILAIFFIIAAVIVYFVSQPKDDTLERTKEFIKTQQEKWRQDSILIDHRMQIEIAKEKLRQAKER